MRVLSKQAVRRLASTIVMGLGALAVASALSSQAVASPTKLVVWDFRSSDPTLADYFDESVRDFEAAHPGVVVQHVAQPHEQYYTLLGTAMAANRGPDVVLLHGGTQTLDRADAFVVLNPYLGDLKRQLVGWEGFTGGNGNIYAVPITLQGQVVYYNKSIYKKAGLNPDNPPTTWAELDADCKQIIAKAKVPCFALGNKEGWGGLFFLNSGAANFWTDKQQAAWAQSKLPWSDPSVTKLLSLWVETAREGWYPRGVNSTDMFPDEYEEFERGETANVLGLISDTAHWKEFEGALGNDKVGTFLPVAISPDGEMPSNAAHLKLPISGGIGWAVTRWSPNKDLAVAYVKSLASSKHLDTLFRVGGAIVSDGQFSRAEMTSPNGRKILTWIACCRAPMAQNAMPIDVMEEFHRDSQELFDGTISVNTAIARLDHVRVSGK